MVFFFSFFPVFLCFEFMFLLFFHFWYLLQECFRASFPAQFEKKKGNGSPNEENATLCVCSVQYPFFLKKERKKRKRKYNILVRSQNPTQDYNLSWMPGDAALDANVWRKYQKETRISKKICSMVKVAPTMMQSTSWE